MQFDHVGIFVKDIEFGLRHLQDLLPISKMSQIYQDPLLNVIVQFCYDNDGVCYELVAPFRENNPVNTALSHNNILNHIAYKSDEFELLIIKAIIAANNKTRPLAASNLKNHLKGLEI